jgi:hypothetical protein
MISPWERRRPISGLLLCITWAGDDHCHSERSWAFAVLAGNDPVFWGLTTD